MEFYFQKLRSDDRDAQGLLKQLTADNESQRWGVFRGLFGLAANELIVLTLAAPLGGELRASVVQQESLQATVRPTTAQPCTRDGLYVLRRFPVKPEHVEELVRLSAQAWQTFAGAAEYASEPMGLFQPQPDERGLVNMLLVTWYDGFESWQRSRTPHPEAVENFRQRQRLTVTTSAIATQLAG